MIDVMEKGYEHYEKRGTEPRWWGTIRERFSPLLICLILALLAALFMGVAIGRSNPVYGIAVAGAIVMVIIVLFRWDELTVTLIIAVHLIIDFYLALHLIGILMALVLLFAYYFGRSANHPWIRPRPLWLWVLFLVLTIYPAINGGQFMAYDAASFYPSDVLGAFLLFWLGSIIAKDISTLRRVFQLLSAFAALVAIHTIIEATTGVFLFATAHVDLHLVAAGNYDIIGTNASRAVSFFTDPNWNGCFLAMMFFLPLGLFMECKSLLGKLVFLAEMAVILVALLDTYSNGAWVALLGGVLAFVFWVGSQRYRLLWVIIIALVALLILVMFPSQLAVQFQRATIPNELSLRLGAWETGIRVIEAFPLFGVGLGGQAYLLRANPYVVPAQVVPLPHPHNTYVQWGAMAGIPVLIVFLLLLGYAFWFSWRNWRAIDIRYRPLLGGGITALIALSINSVSIDGWTNFAIALIGWLIFGMLASPLLHKYIHDARQQERQLNKAVESIETKA
jgi:O-antigen ligase